MLIKKDFREGKTKMYQALNKPGYKRLAAVYTALMCLVIISTVSLASGASATDPMSYAGSLATYAGVFSTCIVTSVNPTATMAILSILGAIENAAVYSPDSAFFNTVADFLNGVPIIREAGRLPLSNPYAAVFLTIVAVALILVHSTAVSELVAKKISLDKLDTIAMNISNVALSLLPLVTNEALAADPPGSKGTELIARATFTLGKVSRNESAGWHTYILAAVTLIAVTIFSNIIRSCVNNWETIVAAFPVKGTSLIWQIVKAILHILLMILQIFAPFICFIISIHLAVVAVILFRILKRISQYYKDVYVFTILRSVFKRNEPVTRIEKRIPRKIRKLYPNMEIAISLYTFHGVARLAKRSRVRLIKDGDKTDIVYKRLIKPTYIISWEDLKKQHGNEQIYLEKCNRFLRIRTEDRKLELVLSNRYTPEIDMLTELLDLKDFAPVKEEIKDNKRRERREKRLRRKKKTAGDAV